MNLTDHIKLAAALQLFWLSIPLIGLGCIEAIKLVRKKTSKEPPYIKKFGIFTTILLYFATGIAVLGIIIIPLYLFSLSIFILKYAYFSILCASLLMILYKFPCYINLFRKININRKSAWLGGTVILIFLILDYYFSLKTGGPLYYDSPLQISKIALFTNSHLTLSDPYFGKNGVIDPRYSTNLINALEALAATIFHTTAVKVWFYSGAVFRLMFSLSLFAIVREYSSKSFKKYSYLVILITPFLYSSFFLYSELPDRIALVWIALLLIGLKVWLEGKGSSLIFLSCFLIACTHGGDALISVGFLLLLAFALMVSRWVNKNQLLTMFLAVAILLPAIFLQLIVPNRLNHDPGYFNASPISGPQLIFKHYGPIQLLSLQAPGSLLNIAGIIFVLAMLYFLPKLKALPLRIFLSVCIVSGLIAFFNVSILSFVGLFYFWKYNKNKYVRLTLILLFIYYGLLVYNPIFIHFANGHIPYWLIARFRELNLIAFVAPILGVLYICFSTLHKTFKKVSSTATPILALLILFGAIYLHNLADIGATVKQSKNQAWNDVQYQQLLSFQPISSVIKNHTVYFVSNVPSLFLPNVTTVNTLTMGSSVDIEVDGSPMANNQLRDECSRYILKSISHSELMAAKINMVILDKLYSPNMVDRLTSLPYLKLEVSTPRYNVYKVSIIKNLGANTLCSIPYGQ